MKKPLLTTIGLVAALAGTALAQPAPPPTPRTPPAPAAPGVPPGPRVPGVPDARWESGPGDSERITRSFKVRDGATFVLANLSGDVTVNARPGNEIAVEALKHSGGRRGDDDGRPGAARVDFSVGDPERGSDRVGRVEVRTVHGDRRGHVRVDFTVSVPPSTLIDIRSMSGDVHVSGVKGETRVETVSGAIQGSGLGGPVALKAVSGDVTLNGAAVDGELAVNSVSGTIIVRDTKARALSATTVSGDLHVTGGACERAVVRSVNGDVEMSAAIVKGGRYEIRSHSGDVRLLVDGKIGFAIDADTFSGDLTSALALTMDSASGDDGRPGHPKSLRGRYGDASAQFEVSTFSGDVTIAKRP